MGGGEGLHLGLFPCLATFGRNGLDQTYNRNNAGVGNLGRGRDEDCSSPPAISVRALTESTKEVLM